MFFSDWVNRQQLDIFDYLTIGNYRSVPSSGVMRNVGERATTR